MRDLFQLRYIHLRTISCTTLRSLAQLEPPNPTGQNPPRKVFKTKQHSPPGQCPPPRRPRRAFRRQDSGARALRASVTTEDPASAKRFAEMLAEPGKADGAAGASDGTLSSPEGAQQRVEEPIVPSTILLGTPV